MYEEDPELVRGYECKNSKCNYRGCELIYNVVLNCASDYNSINTYQFLLTTFDDPLSEWHGSKGVKHLIKQANFFKIPPKNLYKNEDALEKIKQMKKQLLEDWSYMNVNVEVKKVKNPQTYANHKVFRIVGEY